MKKKIIGLFILVVSFLTFIPNVYAGSLTVTSSKTVTTGNKVAVTVKVTGLAGKFKISSSDSSILSGGENGIWLENQTKTFSFSY